MKERYYRESLLRNLAYNDNVNGNCDGMIDFTVIDSISGADVAPVVHGEWEAIYSDQLYQCSNCKKTSEPTDFCPHCGADMRE